MAPHFRASAFEMDDDEDPIAERPSILGYRQTINLHRSYNTTYPNTKTYLPNPSGPTFVRSPVYFTPSRAVQDAVDNRKQEEARRYRAMFGDDDEEKADDSEDATTETGTDTGTENETDNDSSDGISLATTMPMLAGGDVPLLDVSDDEEEQEPDLILCDPTRLTRTKIIDEQGRPMDRMSAFYGAATASTASSASSPRASMASMAASRMSLGMSAYGRGMVDPAREIRELRPDSVIKSGLLFRQGFGFRNGGWKVRYVELTSSHMAFFTEENGRKRGEIALNTCLSTSIDIMPKDSLFDGAQATMWRFAFKAKGRRVLLAAYTEAEMKEWLRCLHVALHVQTAGVGRYTDLIVPNGTLLAQREDGQLRMSGSTQVRWWHSSSYSQSLASEPA